MKNPVEYTRLDMEHMKDYLQDYDILRQKYFWDINKKEIPGNLVRMAVALEGKQNGLKNMWTLSKAQDAFLTVRKVYDDATVDYLGILQPVLEKFIGDFTGIDGVERLFKDSYFSFEWMMHLEYNPDKHEYTKYRDHYIHQIKNMYEMLILLDHHGFMDCCMKAYQDKTNDISNDIKASIREEIRCADSDGKDFFKAVLMYKMELQKKTELPDEEAVQERIQQYYYRQLFHSVAIIASLIHDIGYPITFMLRMAKNLHEFLPLSDAFLRLDDAMPHLEEILQESLLYRTVDSREIAERINSKRDHGSISAVMLLSQYYETGEIYHLSPVKRMAVELSALVIYNHTLKYKYMTGKKGERYRNLFSENPISYLFRLCDNLQEWGRVYFDISRRSNFLICSRCHMPSTRTRRAVADGEHIYSCGCGDVFVRRTKLSYRKLTNIAACNELTIVDQVGSGSEDHCMVITLGYDLVTLLQLSLYNPSFAKQRADDMYEIKRMLEGQQGMPNIYVDAFLSNNPITIKVRCLEHYLQKQDEGYTLGMDASFAREDLTKMALDNLEMADSEKIRDRFTTQAEKYVSLDMEDIVGRLGIYRADPQQNDAFISVWKRNLGFYVFMSIIGKDVEKMRKEGKETDQNKEIAFSKRLADEIADSYKIQDRPTRVLMMDYIWQRIRNVSIEEFGNTKTAQKYFAKSLSTDYMINVVTEYVGSDAYDDVKEALNGDESESIECKLENIEGIYDFFTDYELFAAMARYETHSESFERFIKK